jgi:hypothetical protein
LVRHNVEAILILEKDGMPKFFMQLDPKAFELDPTMVSGFFAAIDMFSKEVFDTRVRRFQIDYGARLFTVITGVKTNLVAISYGSLHEKVEDILDTLLGEFELDWLASLDSHNLDMSFVDNYLESYGERVMQRLSFRTLPDKWVPYFVTSIDEKTAIEIPLSSLVNGVRSIESLRAESGLSQKNLLIEVSKLWARRLIKFRDMLGLKDFISPKPALLDYSHSDSKERIGLEMAQPAMVGIVPLLVGLIDGRRNVQEIIHQLQSQYEERTILAALDHLLNEEALEVLSFEKRRILLAKDALDIALRVAGKVYSISDATSALKSVVKIEPTPETVSQLRLTGGRWTVDFDFNLYESVPHKRIMVVYGEWMKIIAQFVNFLEVEGLEAFIVKLTDAFIGNLFGRYSHHDFRGFEEFGFWLELLSKKMWSDIKPSGKGKISSIESAKIGDIASILIRRGQAIYGADRVVDLCVASGIDMTDDVGLDWLEGAAQDSMERVLINYSKMGPAARMTLLILAKQFDVTLSPSMKLGRDLS